jgi:hypothetical protein
MERSGGITATTIGTVTNTGTVTCTNITTIITIAATKASNFG